MARLPRPFAPGIPAHIIVRGNNRNAIFRSEGDRLFFHRCLVEASRRFELGIHAYVMMANHVHLLATGTSSDSAAKVVQAVGRRYVSYFNYLHGRTGTLWEGRYRSCLVQSDRYFLACQRYLEMNPVRAGIVAMPERFPWSSHRFHIGAGEDDLLTPHPLYLGLAEESSARIAAYRGLFEQEESGATVAAIRESVNTGWALGDAGFCREVERLANRRVTRGRAGRRISSIGV